MIPDRRGFKRWVKVGIGWSLLLVGIAGLFLPVIQGLLCIAGGLTLLSSEYRWAGACLDWVKHHLRRQKADRPATHPPALLVEFSTSHARGEDPPIATP
jgi:hypothetical protein